MLAKLENLYLDILRFVTLAIATIALIAFVIALFNARGILGTLIPAPPPPISREAITFDRYLEETQPAPAAASESPADSAAVSAVPIREAARQLAEAFRRIVCRGNCYGADSNLQERIELQIRQTRDSFDSSYQSEYEASILAFATALNASRDQRLSEDDFGDAIGWHDTAFRTTINDVQFERDLEKGKAFASASFAGLSLMTFLIVVFFFVLVKIERNLRVVRTQVAEAS